MILLYLLMIKIRITITGGIKIILNNSNYLRTHVSALNTLV